MKKILILDANSLLNRAFYGIRQPLATAAGLPTGAVFGYLNILKKHLDAQRPDFAVAAFDVHAPTFRHRFDPAYKATRKPMPSELALQLPYLRRATEALGISIVEKEGYEADDVLGTLSRVAEEGGNEAVLVTGDRDSYQLVSERTTLFLASTGKDEEITPAVLMEKFGLAPLQMIEVKALAGDASDNISGVRGIGEKTAIKLIAQCGDLDGVYRDPASLPVGPSAKEKLISGKDDAYRSRTLARICREVPELDSIEPYPYRGPNREALRALLVELEFGRLMKAFGLEDEPKSAEQDFVQGTLFDAPAAIETAPDELSLAADTPVPERLFLWFDKQDFYARFDGESYRLTGEVEAFLRRARPIVCDAKGYYHAFAERYGSITGLRVDFDLFLASYVLNSQEKMPTLSRLALVYGKESLPTTAQDDPQTVLTLMERLYPSLYAEISAVKARELFFETELPLTYVLAKMELRGFQVSRAGLQAYGEMLEEAIARTRDAVWELAGEEFLIHSPKQLGQILFEKLGLPAPKKTKTGYATDAETLLKLRHLSPIIDLVLQYRTVSKLHSTYVVGLGAQIREDGRVHTVFQQMLTATGRLSSAEPNLQNIPVRTELGREMRKFFTAKDENHVLVDADYSQIELRLLALMSQDEVLTGYFLEGRDIHTKTASEIFHVSPDKVTPEMRKSAKAVNFGIVYGIGEYSLGQDLGVPMRVAKDYIERYFALFPKIRPYLDGCKRFARENGYVETLFGRQRRVPELKSPKKNVVAFGERVAMNAPLQGTAADVIKMAMVRVDRRLEAEGLKSALVLQVHDELILEAPREEADYAAKLLSEEMEGVLSAAVPLVAEAGIGFRWYDCKS